MAKILIIDDEAPFVLLMTRLCQRNGHQPFSAATGQEGLEQLERIKPDIIIVDLVIGDMSGMTIIQEVRKKYPGTTAIMVTGYSSVDTAVEAMKMGAFDYLVKPFELQDMEKVIQRALAAANMPEVRHAEALPNFVNKPTQLLGESPKMQEVRRLIEKVANVDQPVLLEGEFGSGKQVVARALHRISRRKNAPFRALQISALPEALLDAELFGAANSSQGSNIFIRAQGGIVLLEEINDMPMRSQAQLTLYLEEMANQRQQGTLAQNHGCRLMVTSTVKLEELVKQGKFREDLFYKLSVITISIPPLRARAEDITLLTDYFLTGYAEMTGTKKKEIEKYTMKMLMEYTWPGNVSELQNVIDRACALGEDDKLRPSDLPPKISQKIEVSDEENEKVKHQLPIGKTLDDYIKKQEKMFIQETLNFNGGSKEKTASMLDVSIATLYRKLGLKLNAS